MASEGLSHERSVGKHGRLHLVGRRQATLDAVANDIRGAGSNAKTAVLDALDEAAVDAHADSIAAQHGRLDILINLISTGDVQGTPLVEMSVAHFEQPIHNLVRSTFIKWRAAARYMINQRSGVILAFGGDGDPVRDYSIGGFQVSLAAVDSMRRQSGERTWKIRCTGRELGDGWRHGAGPVRFRTLRRHL